MMSLLMVYVIAGGTVRSDQSPCPPPVGLTTIADNTSIIEEDAKEPAVEDEEEGTLVIA